MKSLIIDRGQNAYPSYSIILETLVDLGYQKVPMVLDVGEFAVRGSIIDVFSYRHSHPIRIEFDGDAIERLSSFHPSTQRSITALESTKILAKDPRRSKSPFLQWGEGGGTELISEFQNGDIVVHETYGIGIFKGLHHLTLRKGEGDYVLIQYKGEDRVYVPLNQLEQIHPYTGGGTEPKINGLHDGVWKRVKERVRKATVECAEEMVQLYKLRTDQTGFSYGEDTVWQIDLEKSFEYEETPDQLQALADVKRDMESHVPMDRILSGDVGYGKTEIFLRAAFKAAEHQKQVALVVPTTLLAAQHFRTFEKRFKDFPYTVAMLSRFCSKKKQKRILASLHSHGLDVVIGTHRLLQKDVVFADLGLVIIDEEHRFGVRHKERLKSLKPNVDILSVSATPIPRTLYIALSGGKEVSLLKTPPEKRKPILTTLSEYHESLIKEAIEKEVKRGGQVLYVFNAVRSMPQKARNLKSLLPHIRFSMAHGQMEESVLKSVMDAFLNKETDVLICSTIMESGMDIPNANTMIIENVENFGLAQLHQLRGRVGRTDKQAYAFLFYKEENLTAKAKKRLQAIREYTALGAGYRLALKDLEIRGAGTLLGYKQHGHMTAVGFELYCALLEDSVRQIQGKPGRSQKTRRPLPYMLIIPESYVPEERERLALYRRVSAFEFGYQIDAFEEELRDRYGPAPDVLSNGLALLRHASKTVDV